MNFHLHVIIDHEINRIIKNKETVLWYWNIIHAYNILLKAKEDWKIYRSWCDNMDDNWACKGHDNNNNN